jgi:hypothetical protein
MVNTCVFGYTFDKGVLKKRKFKIVKFCLFMCLNTVYLILRYRNLRIFESCVQVSDDRINNIDF